MQEVKKTKIITFRVTADEYTQIEGAASASGNEPNIWCRDVALTYSSPDEMITIDNRLIYTEIGCLRFLLAYGFKLLFRDAAEASAWAKAREYADTRADEIFTQLLSRRMPD
jgi:hypothetical protein